jgi:hypothetical protein
MPEEQPYIEKWIAQANNDEISDLKMHARRVIRAWNAFTSQGGNPRQQLFKLVEVIREASDWAEAVKLDPEADED